VAVIRWWIRRLPGRLERYLTSTSFPYHLLTGWLVLMTIYWSTSMPEWMVAGP
jgi:hypothetical protein